MGTKSYGKALQIASQQVGTRRNTELEPSGPVTCAAQPGTTFVIQDLYYNLEQRRKVYVLPAPYSVRFRTIKQPCMHECMCPCRHWAQGQRSTPASWTL